MSETAILQRIRLTASSVRDSLGKVAVVMFRNNTGKLQDRNGRWITYGVGPDGGGGSDLIGWKTIVATEGQRVAVFTALEVKTDTGKLSPPQANFLAVVRAAGGIGEVVRSEADAVKVLSGK